MEAARRKRGLRKFINDIRGCTSSAAEAQRVHKELANIRAKFSGGHGKRKGETIKADGTTAAGAR